MPCHGLSITYLTLGVSTDIPNSQQAGATTGTAEATRARVTCVLRALRALQHAHHAAELREGLQGASVD